MEAEEAGSAQGFSSRVDSGDLSRGFFGHVLLR